MSVRDYKRRNLLKTDVTESDVAELVSFLVSKKSSKTTGAQISVDGGNSDMKKLVSVTPTIEWEKGQVN